MGAIEKVRYSDWATLVVPVPKPDGMVRVSHIDQHPIPKAEDFLGL